MLRPAQTQSDSVKRGTRYLVRFRKKEELRKALASAEEAGDSGVKGCEVVNSSLRRKTATVRVRDDAGEEAIQKLDELKSRFDVRVREEYRYDIEQPELFDAESVMADDANRPSLDEVLAKIRAGEGWQHSRGEGVTLAVVDTGIDGSRPEFAPGRRHSQAWALPGTEAWADANGHGTMCAAIAAGSRADGGAFDGVAPGATIMACRTPKFYETELADIYDDLADLAESGEIVVASNSFGIRTGEPPPLPEDNEFVKALTRAIRAGVYVFFSAGNYHSLAGGADDGHDPNSIWYPKGRSDVFVTGATKLDGRMWYYSSRGPGQSVRSKTKVKPDAVGVTPEFGRIVYGSEIRVLKDGWGTSGCSPQAAGLAALLLSANKARGQPPLPRGLLFDRIRQTCVTLGHHPLCQGHGRIDCGNAFA